MEPGKIKQGKPGLGRQALIVMCILYLLLLIYVHLCGGRKDKCVDKDRVHERGKKTFWQEITLPSNLSNVCQCYGRALPHPTPRAKEKKDNSHAGSLVSLSVCGASKQTTVGSYKVEA